MIENWIPEAVSRPDFREGYVSQSGLLAQLHQQFGHEDHLWAREWRLQYAKKKDGGTSS